jgi:hypothetical protein
VSVCCFAAVDSLYIDSFIGRDRESRSCIAAQSNSVMLLACSVKGCGQPQGSSGEIC